MYPRDVLGLVCLAAATVLTISCGSTGDSAPAGCTTDAECSDTDDCTADTCDTATGQCANDPAPDGTSCDSDNGQCASGACVLCYADKCDDGNDCTADRCLMASGACTNDSEPQGTLCGDGVCDGAGGCNECNTNEDCVDRNQCTVDTCELGSCRHDEVAANGSSCGGAGTCADGVCDGATECGLEPPAVANSSVEKTDGNNLASVATYDCDGRYHLADGPSLTCTAGIWEGTVPSCTCDGHVASYTMVGKIFAKSVVNLAGDIGIGATSDFGTTARASVIRLRLEADGDDVKLGTPADPASVELVEFFLPQEFEQCPLSNPRNCEGLDGPSESLYIDTDLDGIAGSPENECPLASGQSDGSTLSWGACSVPTVSLSNQCYFPSSTEATACFVSASVDSSFVLAEGSGPGCLRTRAVGNVFCHSLGSGSNTFCEIAGLVDESNTPIDQEWDQKLSNNAVLPPDEPGEPSAGFTIGNPDATAEMIPNVASQVVPNEINTGTGIALEGTLVSVDYCVPEPDCP